MVKQDPHFKYMKNLEKYKGNKELKQKIKENLGVAEEEYKEKTQDLFSMLTAVKVSLAALDNRPRRSNDNKIHIRYLKPKNLFFRRTEKQKIDPRKKYMLNKDTLLKIYKRMKAKHRAKYFKDIERSGKSASKLILSEIGLTENEILYTADKLKKASLGNKELKKRIDSFENAFANLQEQRKNLFDSGYKWALNIASKYYHIGIDKDDIIQGALIGLWEAVPRYIKEKSKFLTYATDWIEKGIDDVIREQKEIISVPKYMSYLISQVENLRNKGKKRKEIAENLDTTVDRLEEIINIGKKTRTTSINKIIDEKGEEAKIFIANEESIRPDKELDKQEIKKMVRTLLDTLNEKEEYVIKMRFFHNMTYEETGNELGITREGVRQIEEKAKEKINKRKEILTKDPVRFHESYIKN